MIYAMPRHGGKLSCPRASACCLALSCRVPQSLTALRESGWWTWRSSRRRLPREMRTSLPIQRDVGAGSVGRVPLRRHRLIKLVEEGSENEVDVVLVLIADVIRSELADPRSRGCRPTPREAEFVGVGRVAGLGGTSVLTFVGTDGSAVTVSSSRVERLFPPRSLRPRRGRRRWPDRLA